jgi:hypothetical protein
MVLQMLENAVEPGVWRRERKKTTTKQPAAVVVF